MAFLFSWASFKAHEQEATRTTSEESAAEDTACAYVLTPFINEVVGIFYYY
jgi:hypothetical protein